MAEGIETTHESHKLQAMGCDIGQGYLFAKPMPLGQLLGMMRKRLARIDREFRALPLAGFRLTAAEFRTGIMPIAVRPV